MALCWDFSKCPNWKDTGRKHDDGEAEFAFFMPDGTEIPWAVTDALIWLSMFVDYGWDIKKDIEEFVFRVAVYQKVRGPMLRGGKTKNGPYIIPSDVVRAHAGMDTNVATKTRRQFLKKMIDGLAEDTAREIKREAEKNEEEKKEKAEA